MWPTPKKKLWRKIICCRFVDVENAEILRSEMMHHLSYLLIMENQYWKFICFLFICDIYLLACIWKKKCSSDLGVFCVKGSHVSYYIQSTLVGASSSMGRLLHLYSYHVLIWCSFHTCVQYGMLFWRVEWIRICELTITEVSKTSSSKNSHMHGYTYLSVNIYF